MKLSFEQISIIDEKEHKELVEILKKRTADTENSIVRGIKTYKIYEDENIVIYQQFYSHTQTDLESMNIKCYSPEECIEIINQLDKKSTQYFIIIKDR